VAKGKDKSGRLSVFKGREARLNKAIFHTLALKGPQTIYDIHKQIQTQRVLRYTRYSSVNKRVRALEETEFVQKAALRKTKAGFEAIIYELTAKAYLSMLLNSMEFEQLLDRLDQRTASLLLVSLLNVL